MLWDRDFWDWGGGQPQGRRLACAASLACLLVVFSMGLPLAAQDSANRQSKALSEGERLLRENKPAEALPFLEQAIRDPKADENAWLWLAISYQQSNRIDDALSTLRKGLAKATTRKELFYYNMGNLFLLQGKASFAKEMFDSAITANPNLAPAFLNRANANLMVEDRAAARDDYSRYLTLAPNAPQKANIQALLDRLGTAIVQEQQKKASEDAAIAAAAQAKQSLLDEVAASLKAAAEETTNLAAGSGQVQGYGDELPPSD